ncbi:MAG: hypothetical protein ACOCWJ_06345 [Verrucomicrobiota bacterium]
MQALKQHYEKIALAVLVVALLALSLNYVQQVREAKDRQDQIDAIATVPKDDRQLAPLTDEAFDAANMLRNPDVAWETRDGTGNIVYPGQLMWCKNQDCNYWLPSTQALCPYCGAEQDVEEETFDPPQDDDGDGIPNVVEEEYEFLDPNDPRDALLDEDGDWFTNIHEINVAKTDPVDPADHPPLATKLALLDIKRTRFDIVFSSLMGDAEAPKDEWDIAVQVFENGRWRTRFLKVGAEISGKGYTIEDVNRKVEQVYSKAVGAEIAQDASELILRGPDGEQMILPRRQQQYKGVVITFFLNTDAVNSRQGRAVTAREDEILVLTDAAGNQERYTVTVRGRRAVMVKPEGAPDAPGFLVEPPKPVERVEERGGFQESGMPPEFMPDGGRAPAPDWYRQTNRRDRRGD